MSLLANQPTNINFLSPLGFRFKMDRLPTVEYFLTQAEVPNISLGEYDENTPLTALPYPGDKLRFDPLTITFNVFDYLNGLGYPESTAQYAELRNQQRATTSGQDQNIYSDASLILLTSSQNPNVNIRFQNLFPISLSAISLQSTDSDVTYVQATASFRYTLYKIELINN